MNGKLVIVTGASRGIGRDIALRLASEGAKVGCVATTLPNAEATAELIRNAGGEALAAAADVSSMASVEEAFAVFTAAFGAPYGLVNNAGIARDQLIIRMSEDDFDRVIAVNLKGAWNCTKAVTKAMMKAREGRIVNISSVNGLHGAAGQSNYSASKAGLIGLTKSIARELGSRGITCNAVAPGFIETDMTEELTQEMRDHVAKTAPLGRLGSPADIAGPVAFFLSKSANYVTGQVLTVDGGLYI